MMLFHSFFLVLFCLCRVEPMSSCLLDRLLWNSFKRLKKFNQNNSNNNKTLKKYDLGCALTHKMFSKKKKKLKIIKRVYVKKFNSSRVGLIHLVEDHRKAQREICAQRVINVTRSLAVDLYLQWHVMQQTSDATEGSHTTISPNPSPSPQFQLCCCGVACGLPTNHNKTQISCVSCARLTCHHHRVYWRALITSCESNERRKPQLIVTVLWHKKT